MGKTFGIVTKFKDAVVRFSLVQGFDFKIDVSDLTRKRIVAFYTKSYNFKVYDS